MKALKKSIQCISITLFIILLNNSLTVAGDNEWTYHGPYGASTFGIDIHPQDRNILYAATINRGVYKSTDGGESWELRLGNLNHMTPLDIKIHPANPNVLFVADAEYGVVMSKDGGKNWDYVYKGVSDLGTYIHFVEINPHNTDHIIAGGGSNIVISQDGGYTWQRSDYFRGIGTMSAEFDPADPQVIYIGTVEFPEPDKGGLYKSIDGGETWDLISSETPGMQTIFDIAIDLTYTDRIFFGGTSHDYGGFSVFTGECSLYRSLDGGISWECVGLEMESVFVRKIVIDSFHSPPHVYVATFDKGVWKSTDGGDSWFPINNGLKEKKTLTIVYDLYTQILYLGTYYGCIYRSFDGGENWEEISQGIYGSNINRMAINPLDSKTIYVSTNYSGFYRTNDKGNAWIHLSNNVPTTHEIRGVGIDPADTSIVYIGTWEDGIFKSNDGGDTWEKKSNGLPDSAMVEEIVGYSDTSIYRVYASLYRDGVYLSKDGGESWVPRINGLPEDKSTQRLVIDPIDPDILYVATWEGLYKSLDGGLNWERKSRGFDNEAFQYNTYIDPSNHERVYVLTETDVYKSEEGGRHWYSLNMDIPTSWPYPQPMSLIIDPQDPTHLVMSVSPIGVYESFDQGTSWQAMNQGFPTYVIAWNLELDPQDPNTYIAGTNGTSLCMYTKSPVGVEDAFSGIIPLEYNLHQNYPNPFNAVTTIEYSLPQNSWVNLTVHNILGQQIELLVDSEMGAGFHNASWNASDIPSGVYFYTLKTDNFQHTKKMLLLK